MLKIPRTVDYGVLILVTLYETEEPGCMSAPTLAQHCGLSPQHVAKILKILQRQGIVGSVRGPKGGYFLRPKGREMNLIDVYRSVEGPLFISECLRENTCDCRALPRCRLKPHIERLNQQIHQAMASISLAQLSHEGSARSSVLV